jgi:putative flippase GtrA
MGVRGLLGGPGPRFALLSAQSFGVNLGLTALLHDALGVPAERAFAVALAVVFALNFVGLRYFVHPGQARGAGRQLALFLASSAGFRGLEYAAFLIVHSALRVPYGAAIAAILATSLVAKHFFYKSWVFSPRTARPELATSCRDRSR